MVVPFSVLLRHVLKPINQYKRARPPWPILVQYTITAYYHVPVFPYLHYQWLTLPFLRSQIFTFHPFYSQHFTMPYQSYITADAKIISLNFGYFNHKRKGNTHIDYINSTFCPLAFKHPSLALRKTEKGVGDGWKRLWQIEQKWD